MTLLDADTTFTTLYHEHRSDVWKLAAFKLSDPHEAEDALQETFLRAYRSRGRFRREGAERAWLLTICRNVCLDRLRARAARGVVYLEDALVDPALPTVDVDRRIDLRAGLAALPAEDLEAFFLVDVLGIPSHEAAAVLGLRASSTLRSRVGRARGQLEQALLAPPLLPGRAEVWGVFHAPPARAIVVARAAAGEPAPGIARVPESDLVEFLESLEQRVPEDRPLLAVVRADGDAGAWVARHPRWRLRSADSREGWLRDAERLLEGHDRTLALLRAAKRFVWTAGP